MNELVNSYKNRRTHNDSGKQIYWVGITGLNGKSMTLQLTRLMLEEYGYRVAASFNGENLWEVSQKADIDFVLVECDEELSNHGGDVSFDVSAITNIGEGHLNHVGSYQDYMLSKAMIYQNTKIACIFDAFDSMAHNIVQIADVIEGCRAVGFTHHSPSRSQIGFVEGILLDRAYYEDNEDPLRYLTATELADLTAYENLKDTFGKLPYYLVRNICAAAAIVRAFGVDTEAISKALTRWEFPNGVNELIYQGTVSDYYDAGSSFVQFVDNSGARNIEAAYNLLRGYKDNSMVVIATSDIGIKYGAYINELIPKTATLIYIGSETDNFWKEFSIKTHTIPKYFVNPVLEPNPLKRALELAVKEVFPGQKVVYLPAAKRDYPITFKQLVLNSVGEINEALFLKDV